MGGPSDAPRFSCRRADPPTVDEISPLPFPVGKVITVGVFTCKVLETGVECTVTETGKGFVIPPETVTAIGG